MQLGEATLHLSLVYSKMLNSEFLMLLGKQLSIYWKVYSQMQF